MDWLWTHLDLRSDCQILDITCGPASTPSNWPGRRREVTGIDFSPASIRYARTLAAEQEIDDR